jgi:hypothetical protein
MANQPRSGGNRGMETLLCAVVGIEPCWTHETILVVDEAVLV